ncbi:MAG: hypothetical protein IPI24_14200 [Ignavibacteria bacterium]|nr:hypothetical protein [Ignavibacteria bacterium]
MEKNKDLEVRVYSDASKIGIGGVVTQENKFVGAYSRPFKKKESEWAPIDRELKAVVEVVDWVTRRFGKAPKRVGTDHQPLTNGGWRKLDKGRQEAGPEKGASGSRRWTKPTWTCSTSRARRILQTSRADLLSLA